MATTTADRTASPAGHPELSVVVLCYRAGEGARAFAREISEVLAAAGILHYELVLVANYVGDVETEVGDKMVVLELTQPVKANQAIADEMVTEKVIPRRWAPKAALTDVTQLTGYVAAADLAPNSILQEGMLSTPPQIRPGQREVAILVDASTGVAGRISPGSHVDVIAAYGAADPKPGETQQQPNRTEVIVPGGAMFFTQLARIGRCGPDEQFALAIPDHQAAVEAELVRLLSEGGTAAGSLAQAWPAGGAVPYRGPDGLKNLYNDPDKNKDIKEFVVEVTEPGRTDYEFSLSAAGKDTATPGPHSVKSLGSAPTSVFHPISGKMASATRPMEHQWTKRETSSFPNGAPLATCTSLFR